MYFNEVFPQAVGVESWGRGIPPTRGTSAADANIRAMRLILNIKSTHYLTTFDTFCHSVTVVVVHWQRRMFVVESLDGNAAGIGCLFSFVSDFFFLLLFSFFTSSEFSHFLTLEFFSFFLSTNRKLFIYERVDMRGIEVPAFFDFIDGGMKVFCMSLILGNNVVMLDFCPRPIVINLDEAKVLKISDVF